MQELGGGAAAMIMRPPVQTNYKFVNGGGFINDSITHKFHEQQTIQQVQQSIQHQLRNLDTFSFPATRTNHPSIPVQDVNTRGMITQKFSNYGGSTVVATAAGAPYESTLENSSNQNSSNLGSDGISNWSDTTPQVKGCSSNVGPCNQSEDMSEFLVRGAKRRLSWSSQTLQPDSPDYKLGSEPRSVLDLRTSPPQLPRSGADPSCDFSTFSLGDSVFLNDDHFSYGNYVQFNTAKGASPCQVLADTGNGPQVPQLATPQNFHGNSVHVATYNYDSSKELGSIVSGTKRRSSWAEEEVELGGFSNSSEESSANSDLNTSDYHLSTLPIISAHVLSPPTSPRPHNYKTPEPRSVLDWKTSPPSAAKYTVANPSDDLATFTLDDGFLLDDELFSELQRQLMVLEEEDGELPSTTSTVDVHENSVCHRHSHNSGKGELDKGTTSNSYNSLPPLPIPAHTLIIPPATLPRPSEYKKRETGPAFDFASATLSPKPSPAGTPLSYDKCAVSSLGRDALLEDIFSSFHRRDSSLVEVTNPEVFGLEENDESDNPPPPSSSTMEWLEETSQLWDALLDDDFGYSPRGAISLPRLKLEHDSSPSPTSSLSEVGQASSSFDHGAAELDETTTTTVSTIASEIGANDFVKFENRETLKGLNSGPEEHLVNLLLACAEAVSTMSISLVNPLFAQLGELASPEGTTLQRIAAYFTEGLAYRCTQLWPHIYQPLPDTLDLNEEDTISAFHVFNHVCPYTKFAHFTANNIILEAFERCDRVHVIDFDIKQGLQWPALFQSLAARPEGPPSQIKVTGVGENKEDVHDTGDRLAEFAEALDLPFEFHAVIDKLEDVRLWMLHVKENETVAVNCVMQLHRILRDKENGIKDLLGLIASTKPKIVAVVEQEASHNGDSLEGRFLSSLQYYSALFDSISDSKDMVTDDMKGRLKVERLLAREIRNIVGYEGSERFERHEMMKTWRLHMETGGFKGVNLSKRARTQAQLLLDLFSCESYKISDDENDDTLTLGWQNIPLYSASAWTPML
ncbi:unnamed protein product [Calypogeia fissa]